MLTHRGVGVQGLDGGNVDDVALAGLLHGRHQEARQAHGRHQIDVRLLVPVVRVACSGNVTAMLAPATPSNLGCLPAKECAHSHT